MKAIFAFLCIVILAGCAPTPAFVTPLFTPTAYRVEATQAYVDDRLQQVRDSLKDPESARFSSVYTTKRTAGDPSVNVCGYVNAKNSYGGYVGAVRFFASPGYVAVWENQRGSYSPAKNTVIRNNCTLRAGEMRPDGYRP